MGAEPSPLDVSSPSGPEPAGGHPWLRAIALLVPVVLFVALLRWAVDVLLLVCVVLLLAHSTRDTLQDWLARESFEGEPDPIWAVGAVCIGVFGIVVSGFWLFSTSELGNELVDRYVPAVTETVAFGERFGWGGRAVLPVPSRARSKQAAMAGPPRAASVAPLDVTPTGSFPGPDDERADPTRDADPGERAPVATAGGLVATKTTIRTSETRVERGTALTLTAEVSASTTPVGTVLFRRGTDRLGIANVDAKGRATIVVDDLLPGTNEISAEFLGSSTLRSSRSAPLRVIVR